MNALRELMGHFKKELAPSSFRELKRTLAADCRQQRAALSRAHASRSVRRRLTALSGQLASLRLKGSGWSAVAPGVRRSYRDGYRGYRLASATGNASNFHEWRKRVKDLYYQLRLLCPLWPEQMGAAEAELKRLADYLGDDHDLSLLTEAGASKRFP